MTKINIKNTPSIEKARSRLHQDVFVIRDEVAVPERLFQIVNGKHYFVRTYGCQANVRDEENIKGLLELAGMKETESIETADLVILNTCAVRENAENKVFGELGILKVLKSKNKNLVIAVGGCMIQQSHIVEIIQTKLTHVDLMFGTHNIHQLLDLLDEVYGSKTRIIDVTSKYGEIIENIPSKRGSHFKAYVNTMFGCDKFCTYCIVPYTRGKERSRLVEDILIECAQLVKEGYQEITLLGQNVNAYGKDLANKTDFSFLLEKVALLGIPRLRFMTSHPWDFTDKMIEVIATHDNIMKTIHLPFQSGNNEILRQMGRRYTKESYRDLVTRMKNKIPNLALTTDIIVGFPGETQSQFEDTLDMVNFVGFDGCFTFIYSPRKGTPASKMTDNVTMEEKHTRFDRLLEIVEIQAVKKADQMVGQVFDVLVDGISKRNENILAGYTRSNKLVHFKGSETLIGKIVNVRIEESHLYSMSGTLINE